MSSYILSFPEIDKTQHAIVGGKGANLGALSGVEGLSVPEGFCITTKAYKEIVADNASFNLLLDQLALLKAEDRKAISETSAKIRDLIENISIPKYIGEEIRRYLTKLGEKNAYAVRSSATAEDLQTASFAGQQDTYLNITGVDAILQHISKCWASLYTDRAVSYRLQNGFDHKKVYLAVVIQRMIFPDVAGIMFTADPVTSNRKIVSIDASFGLGEALVSGIVNADNYKVREGKIIDKKIVVKKLAVLASEQGGTKEQEIAADQQNVSSLTDKQIITLNELGRKIEAHFGKPQDIEWCLSGDTFYIVQSRPITTLYPIPETNDHDKHLYISVGHQQMMTDAMKPLGLSIWQMTTVRPMHEAGGRLFVDIAKEIASPATREMMVNVLGKSHPLIKDALQTIIARGDLADTTVEEKTGAPADKNNKSTSLESFQTLQEYDPAIVTELIKQSESSIDASRKHIQTKSGLELLDFIREDFKVARTNLANPQGFGVIMTAMNAASWINDKMKEWLGETNTADALSQSVANNVTSEMGLALLDVADVIRPYPEVVAYLQHTKEDNFLDVLPMFKGGQETKDAINAFLDKYGMRCAGEIDITKTRWSEKPAILIPLILGNIRNFSPNASQQKFEQGQQEALKKEQTLLARLSQLPGGEEKVQETKKMISLVRNLSGYREYPKYALISHYFVYKQALLKEAERLVQANVLHAKEDIYYLTFEELREVVRTHQLDDQLIDARKEAYKLYEKLTAPLVMTSDGEIITGTYKKENMPDNAMIGIGVSSGVIEGRARVITSMEDADIGEDDILVTAYTDPSWTPLFVSIKGLVTEVGGLMTHGAVIAREYGLPAVVAVAQATKLIKDGQRIRVNGTEGYVELL